VGGNRAVRVAVLASGRGSNFEAILTATRAPAYPAEIVLLVSDKPDAPALARATDAGIATAIIDPGTRRGDWQAPAVARLLDILARHRTEAVCLAGFMRIVPAEILRAYPRRVLNIHPALLPSFPGLHGQRQALRHGAKVAGCTVHFVDEGVDTGPIILQAAVPVAEDDTEETLAARILVEEHRLYPEAVRLLAEGRLEVDGRRVHVLPASRAGASRD
jgi:phosphoribosylglycinamide formyltransferase-1